MGNIKWEKRTKLQILGKKLSSSFNYYKRYAIFLKRSLLFNSFYCRVTSKKFHLSIMEPLMDLCGEDIRTLKY